MATLKIEIAEIDLMSVKETLELVVAQINSGLTYGFGTSYEYKVTSDEEEE